MAALDPQIIAIGGSIAMTLITAISFLTKSLLSAKDEAIKERDHRITTLENTIARLEGMLGRSTAGFERAVKHRAEHEESSYERT